MADYIVNPQSLCSTDDSSSSSGGGSGGTTVTSGLTYDGGTLNCIMFYQGNGLNANLQALNKIICKLRDEDKVINETINDLNNTVNQLTSNINNLQVGSIGMVGYTSTCLNISDHTLGDYLTILEEKVCSIESSIGGIVCADDGQGSGSSVYLYRDYYSKSFVHNKSDKFDLSNFGTAVVTVEAGSTTDGTGCTQATTGSILDLTINAISPASYQNKDVYLRNKKGVGLKFYIVSQGGSEPALVSDETPLYKLVTNGAGVISLDTDQREYTPYDQTIFRSDTDLTQYISSGTITGSQLDLSSVLTYDAAHTITNAADIVHKSYVDTAIAAIPAGIWTPQALPATGIGFASSVGIGTLTPTGATLHVQGSVKIADGTEAAGRYFVCDVDGVGSWTAATPSTNTLSQVLTAGSIAASHGSDIQLGTTLSSSVTSLTLVASTAYTELKSQNSGVSEAKLGFNTVSGDLRYQDLVTTNNYSQVIVNEDAAKIVLHRTAAEKSIDLKDDGATAIKMLVTDSIRNKGLEYAAAYKGNFTTYSLVDKDYVDTAIAGIGGGSLSAESGHVAGDAGYVTRWTALNTLGKGVIRDDGTTVSIGGVTESTTSFKVISNKTRAISQTGSTSYNYFEGTLMLNYDHHIANANVYTRIKEGISAGSVAFWATEDPFGTYYDLTSFISQLGFTQNVTINNNSDIVGYSSQITFTGNIDVGTNVDVYNFRADANSGSIPSAKTIENWSLFHADDTSHDSDLAITNYYSLYLGTNSGTGIVKNWGIYQKEPTQANYFAGSVGLNNLTPSSFTRLDIVSKTSDIRTLDIEHTSSGANFGLPHAAINVYMNPSGSVGSKGLVGIRAAYGGNNAIGLTGVKAAIYSTVVSTESLTSIANIKADGVEASNGHTIDTATVLMVGANRTDGTGVITDRYGIYQSGGSDLNYFEGCIAYNKQVYHVNGTKDAGSGSSASFNLNEGVVQKYVMTSATTGVSNPTNAFDGSVYTLCFIQDATGSRNVNAWGNQFNWGDAGAPDFSSGGANKKHYVTLVRNGSVFDAIYSGVIH